MEGGGGDKNNNKMQGSIDLVKRSPKVRTALTEMVKRKLLKPGKNCLHFKINDFVYKGDISEDAYIVYHRSSLKMNKKSRYFKGPLNFVQYICKKFHVEMLEDIAKKDPWSIINYTQPSQLINGGGSSNSSNNSGSSSIYNSNVNKNSNSNSIVQFSLRELKFQLQGMKWYEGKRSSKNKVVLNSEKTRMTMPKNQKKLPRITMCDQRIIDKVIENFRKVYFDDDFRKKDTFPNSKLPLPGMYMYLTIRGSFINLKTFKNIGSCSKYSDVYWFCYNKKTQVTTKFRSSVEVRKYIELKHPKYLADVGLKLMFNSKSCMKLKHCILHVGGTPKPPHPFNASEYHSNKELGRGVMKQKLTSSKNDMKTVTQNRNGTNSNSEDNPEKYSSNHRINNNSYEKQTNTSINNNNDKMVQQRASDFDIDGNVNSHKLHKTLINSNNNNNKNINKETNGYDLDDDIPFAIIENEKLPIDAMDVSKVSSKSHQLLSTEKAMKKKNLIIEGKKAKERKPKKKTQKSRKQEEDQVRLQHDKKYFSRVSKYIVELSDIELESLKVNDFVYVFYPGTNLSDRKYGKFKISSRSKSRLNKGKLYNKKSSQNTLEILWEPNYPQAVINKRKFYISVIRPAKLKAGYDRLPSLDVLMNDRRINNDGKTGVARVDNDSNNEKQASNCYGQLTWYSAGGNLLSGHKSICSGVKRKKIKNSSAILGSDEKLKRNYRNEQCPNTEGGGYSKKAKVGFTAKDGANGISFDCGESESGDMMLKANHSFLTTPNLKSRKKSKIYYSYEASNNTVDENKNMKKDEDIDGNKNNNTNLESTDENTQTISETYVLQNSRELKLNETIPANSYVYIVHDQTIGWEIVQVIETKNVGSNIFMKLLFQRGNKEEESMLHGYWFGKQELSLRIPLGQYDPNGPICGSDFPAIYGCNSNDFTASKRCPMYA